MKRSVVGLTGLVIILLSSAFSSKLLGRDILLIDDSVGGFGPVAGILAAEGHNVTELTGEAGLNYSRVSDSDFLSNFDMVVFSNREFPIFAPPAAANFALETYAQNGGDLLVTGIRGPGAYADRSFPNLLRVLGPESDLGFMSEQNVTGTDNFITNGPHGDFRGAAGTSSSFGNIFPNTALGTISLVEGLPGEASKILFTDLPGAGGSIGAWQGSDPFDLKPAQPDFFDGGVFQGLLLNWAEGGTTSQTEVVPRVFSTDVHPLQSTVSIDLYLGDPNDGGGFVGSLNGIELEGTMDIISELDAAGDGTLAITNASLIARDMNDITLDLGLLGSMQIDVEEVELYLGNQPTVVTQNGFDLNDSPYFAAGFTEAVLEGHSPTGALELLLDGALPATFDIDELFYGGPITLANAGFDGTFDEGLGLETELPELNIGFQEFSTYLFNFESLGDVYGVINGEIHVAYVPEPSGLILSVLSMAGFFAACRRRRR